VIGVWNYSTDIFYIKAEGWLKVEVKLSQGVIS
jgi:hypothetical protein